MLRCVVAGAAPPTRTIERVETELGWEFNQIYGLTETAPLLTVNRRRSDYDDLTPAKRAALLGRAGAPAMGVEIKISDDGEVLARSNVIMEGYWNQPAETAKAMVADTAGRPWFHTGDGGSLDDEHYVSISDRKKDVIISGGENVSSIEVEDALFQHPAVAEVAVIGVPDEKWGELVTALVVLSAGASPTRLNSSRSPSQARRIQVSEEDRVSYRAGPTTTGKLQKFKLREPYWSGRTRR